jgi:DNA-binding NarL/FixJ family response regulator
MRYCLTQAGFQVLGEVCEETDTLEAIKRCLPDVLIIDGHTLNKAFIQAIHSLASPISSVPIQVSILAIGDRQSAGEVISFLDNGVTGYVLREDETATIVAAVEMVAKHIPYVSPIIMPYVGYRLRHSAGHLKLTERESEVLRLLARGWDNRQISDSLFLAEQTIKNHISKIYAKLGANSRVTAMVQAIRIGLIRIEDLDPWTNTDCA